MKTRRRVSVKAQLLVQEVRDCSFDCGDWRRDEYDEDYSEAFERSDLATESLLQYISELEERAQ